MRKILFAIYIADALILASSLPALQPSSMFVNYGNNDVAINSIDSWSLDSTDTLATGQSPRHSPVFDEDMPDPRLLDDYLRYCDVRNFLLVAAVLETNKKEDCCYLKKIWRKQNWAKRAAIKIKFDELAQREKILVQTEGKVMNFFEAEKIFGGMA